MLVAIAPRSRTQERRGGAATIAPRHLRVNRAVPRNTLHTHIHRRNAKFALAHAPPDSVRPARSVPRAIYHGGTTAPCACSARTGAAIDYRAERDGGVCTVIGTPALLVRHLLCTIDRSSQSLPASEHREKKQMYFVCAHVIWCTAVDGDVGARVQQRYADMTRSIASCSRTRVPCASGASPPMRVPSAPVTPSYSSASILTHCLP